MTTQRTLQRGERLGQGTEGAYFRLASGPGEPHLRRLDLAPDAPPAMRRQSLLHFAYMTDLHVLDVASPGRYEFVDRYFGTPELGPLGPAYRPHEFLQVQACEAMIRTMNELAGSSVTGAAVQFLLCMGDLTDNAQRNELGWALSLLSGGAVAPGAPGIGYEGVSSVAWGDDAYWHPDDVPDDYKRRWGFPSHPGLLEQAMRPFAATGVRLPWLSSYGNHDAMIQGTARPNPAYEAIVAGAGKPHALPADFAPLNALDLYVLHPELFLAGPQTPITHDPARHTFSRADFVQAHIHASGTPAGHGFASENLAAGTTYYVHDPDPRLRLIVLDTVNLGGNYQGSIGAAQATWLEQRLAEVHRRYWDAEGRLVETGNLDRLVVICSHHGLDTLVNDLVTLDGERDLPRVLGAHVEALLHRFPNVILWVNGHTHFNTVRPRPDPSARTAGFWEVTTSSLIDWPCQARLVEIVGNGSGTLSVLCTMVDHVAPALPAHAGGLMHLAALHRELAANDPHMGLASAQKGEPSDRNVELVIPAPFALV